MTSIFILEILWNYTILWITYISLLQMGMGMSVSPQIWQQFVDLVFQDD